MTRIHRRLGSAMRFVRLTWRNPRLVVSEISYRAYRMWRIRRLRSNFNRMVCSVPEGASLQLEMIDIPSRDQIPEALAASADSILSEANEVIKHRMSFLGAGPLDYGPEIDWLADPVTGYRWPIGIHFDIPVTNLNSADDAKRVWELSRGHQLLTLARASRLDPTNGEAYVAEMVAQFESWIQSNPVGRTINWTNAMEAGIRAANWLTAIAIAGTDQFPEIALERITKCLQMHGRFIFNHLEGSPRMRSNHFVGDLLGLTMLGASINGDADALKWMEASEEWFPREVDGQVHVDGCDFEASLSYHGLVLEMFVLILRTLEESGRRVSEATRDRLRSMVAVAVAVRHPDGRTPQIGDGDSGRILPSGFARSPSLDPIIWVASAIVGLGRPLDGTPDPEVAWTLGLKQWRRSAVSPSIVSGFPDRFSSGGLYILRGGGSHIVVDCGDVGQSGNGGHAHNDTLSFEWSLDGVPVIVDPGTYAYTSDTKARTQMRGTSAHATPQIDNIEINPIDPERPFQLDEIAAPKVESFSVSDESTILIASHGAYMRLQQPVLITRSICLNRRTGSFLVTDQLKGSGRHAVTIPMPLTPDWSVVNRAAKSCVLNGPRATVHVRLEGGAILEVEQGWYSPTFGIRQRALRLVAAGSLDLPATITVEMSRGGPRGD